VEQGAPLSEANSSTKSIAMFCMVDKRARGMGSGSTVWTGS
jgi:hypothetical protein